MLNIGKQIFQEGGLKQFYAGYNFVILGCGPAHAAYFAIYEKTKEYLKCSHSVHSPLYFGISGVIGSFLHDFIMTPCDVLK